MRRLYLLLFLVFASIAISKFFTQSSYESFVVVITNPNSYDLVYYQVRIDLSAVLNEPRYLRVTDENGNELPYCFEQPNGECNTTPSLVIWVKVSRIPANGRTRIVVEISSANHARNGRDVFDLYDDFNDGVLDTNLWRVVGSLDRIEEGNGVLHAWSNNDGWQGIRSVTSFSRNHVLEFRVRIVGDRGGQATLYLGFYQADAADPSPGSSEALSPSIKHVGFGEGWCRDWGLCAEQADGTHREGEWVFGVAGDTDIVFLAKIVWSDSYSRIRLLNLEANEQKETNLVRYVPDESANVFLAVEDHDSGWGPLELFVDWVRVRKFAEQEPRIAILIPMTTTVTSTVTTTYTSTETMTTTVTATTTYTTTVSTTLTSTSIATSTITWTSKTTITSTITVINGTPTAITSIISAGGGASPLVMYLAIAVFLAAAAAAPWILDTRGGFLYGVTAVLGSLIAAIACSIEQDPSSRAFGWIFVGIFSFASISILLYLMKKTVTVVIER